MVARTGSMFGCYDSYSYRLWSLANVWSTCQFPLPPSAGKVPDDSSGAEYFIKCSQCHKGYPGFQALKEHVSACHHSRDPRDERGEGASPGSPSPVPAGHGVAGGYACPQCSTTFLHKDQLEKHELLHSPNAQVSCKVCNKTFANVYRLQRHMISHDESAVLRKFKCPECDKAFKFKHHLKEHIRIHSGEKPFECANCGKRFSHSGSYSSHMTSKKCLVMNLKVGRGRGPSSNTLLEKCPPQQHRGPPGKRGGLPGPLNNNSITNNGNNNNAYAPILPKYGDAAAAFLSAVTPRVTGSYPPPTSHPLPSAPSLHPFYLAAAPTMHLSPHHNSGMNPYKLPPTLGHLLDHLTSTTPSQPRLCSPDDDKKMEDSAGEEHEKESHSSTDAKKYEEEVEKKQIVIKEEREENDVEMEDDEERIEGERCGSPANRNSPGAGSNSGDLEAVKRILETVNATVTKQLLEANMQKLSSTSSGSGCPSIASAASPVALANSSEGAAEYQKSTSGDSDLCKYCQKKFSSKIELHQHERYLCEKLHDHQSEGLAAKLEEAVTVKTEEMSINGGYSGSEEEDGDGRGSGKDPVTEEEEYEGESITTTDQVSEDGRKVRVRSLIADEQLTILKSHYGMNPRPKKDELSRIAEKIGFPVRVVQVWFQNTRARDRREGRLVHVPYLPLNSSLVSIQSSSGFPSASIVPSTTQPSQLNIQAISLGSYSSSASSPRCPSTSAEQPLDLSTKKSQHSLASTPSSSPLRPTSAANHSDSGEEAGGAMNLSRKSSSSRSPTPGGGITNAPMRHLLPFQQPHYQHSSCSSSSLADFRRTPSPLSSLNIHHHNHEGLSNGLSNGSRLARILAQPPVSSHRLVAGLANGTNGGVGLVPMDRLLYGADLHSSRSPLPMFGLAHSENGRACSSSPSSDRRSWKQGYVDGGDTTDEAEDSGCGGVLHDADHSLVEDDSLPSKRHKLSLALGKGALQSLPGLPGLDGEPEGQFICDQCDKAFSKQSSLARHKYEHSGQRPHKCDVCTKAFKHKHHLTEHKRLHSGEKPFQCSKCLKRFSHSGSYSQHMNHRYSYCKPYRE